MVNQDIELLFKSLMKNLEENGDKKKEERDNRCWKLTINDAIKDLKRMKWFYSSIAIKALELMLDYKRSITELNQLTIKTKSEQKCVFPDEFLSGWNDGYIAGLEAARDVFLGAKGVDEDE